MNSFVDFVFFRNCSRPTSTKRVRCKTKMQEKNTGERDEEKIQSLS